MENPTSSPASRSPNARRSSRKRSDRARRTPVQPSLFFAPLRALAEGGGALVLAGLLLVALVVGGGGSPAPMAELAVELFALAVLAWAAWSRRSDYALHRAFLRDPLIVGAGLLLALLMLLQLVPLPPSIWQSLPGREAIIENAKAFPEAPWLPFSISPTYTLAAALALLAPLAAYLLAAGSRPGQRDWFVPLLALFGVATIVLEIAQLGGLLFLYPTNGEVFSRGFQANRNAQGDIIAILFAALACRPFAGGPRGVFSLVQGLVSAVLLLAVVLTGSRAGIALALVALVVVAGRELWAWRHRGGRVLAGAAAAALLALVAGAIALAGNANIARTLDRFSQDENGRVSTIWPDAWYAAQQFFPWGTGFGSFVPAFKIFESQELLDQTVANRAHNEFLELLIEGGVPALALAVIAAALVLWRGWQVLRGGATPWARSRGAMLVLASLLLLAHSVIDYPIRSLSIAVCWALLLGLVTADRAQMRGDPAASEEAHPGGRSRKSSTRRRETIDQTSGQILRKYAALALLVLLVAPVTVLNGFDRAGRPVAGGLSCTLPTPNSCRQFIGAMLAERPKASFSPITEGLARRYPANADVQALHGSELIRGGDPKGTIFLHNSARLGWREPLGQINAFDAAVAAGEIPRAVIHLDALMRAHPDLLEQAGLLDRFLAQDAVRQEWAARLAASPNYVKTLLLHIASTTAGEIPEDPAARAADAAAWQHRAALFALARANGLRISDDTAKTAVTIAFRGDRTRAADLWAAIAGPGGWERGEAGWAIAPAVGELPEGGTPFAWSSMPGRRSALRIERDPGAPGRIVTTRSLTGPATRLATIAFFLGEGYHELRWTVDGAEPSDFFPAIACRRGGQASFDLLDPPATNVGVAAVRVPADCGGAVLSVGKGRGRLPKGAAISQIEIDRKRLLN